MRDFNLSAWAVRHPTLVLFLLLLLLFGGYRAYERVGRAEDPAFTVRSMTVSAAWAGATADEMQRLVADPIERTLQELPHFQEVLTYSRPGVVYMDVELVESTPAAIVPDLWYQVRKRVGDIAADLPPGVSGPFFDDEAGDVDSALYAITGEGADARDLKDQAEVIRQRLLGVPDVERVRLYGEQQERIFVEFSHARLASLGIPLAQILLSIERQNAIVSAGSIEAETQRIHLRVSGGLDAAEAVASVPIAQGGRTVRLGDVAAVTRGFADPPSSIVRHRGRQALMLGVVMARGADILTLGERLEAAIAAARADLPVGFDLEQVADQPAVVEASVGDFLQAFVEALVIVLFVSFLSLGWRTGIVVALAVPVTLAIVLIVMQLWGMSLERITLGALIIALGLMVDDAIIATEMMVVRMEEGLDRLSAASFAWTSTAFPMLTGTLITAAGFLPIGLARSATGEYAGGIFWVVAIALVASWVVAVIFTPFLGMKLLPEIEARHSNTGGSPSPYHSRAYNILRTITASCVQAKWHVAGVTLTVFVMSLWAFSFVQQQFFPSSTRPELIAELRLPEGSTIAETQRAAERLEVFLAADPEVTRYTTYIGRGVPRFFLTMNTELPKETYAATVVMTAGEEARERVSERLAFFAQEGGVPEARLRVSALSLGPSVGFPVQFRVTGRDPTEVRRIALAVRDRMRHQADLVDIHLDWGEMAKAVRLEVDQERARLLGLTPQDIGHTLETLLSGRTVTQLRDGFERIDVVARAVAEERLDLERLPDISIPVADGRSVPLSQIASLVYDHEEPILWRRNREVVMIARADVIRGVQALDASARAWAAMADLRASLTVGYEVEIGGAAEESDDADDALSDLFPVMVLVMLTLLMIQLQSFSRVFLVLATAPLGLVGASAALLILDRPFGFVALLGVIALAGMIMRNAVILVDQIEREQAAGASPFDAVVEATVRRARPVLLTALAAILAMIPLSTDLFWGPMAVAIMGGLTVATMLTLVFVPALYAICFRVHGNLPKVTAKVAAVPMREVARSLVPIRAFPLGSERREDDGRGLGDPG